MKSLVLLFCANWNLTLDALLQRDKCLCRYNSVDALQLVVEQMHKLLVVTHVELYEHSVRTSSEMAFHNLWDVLELLNYILVHRTALKSDTYIGTSAVTK